MLDAVRESRGNAKCLDMECYGAGGKLASAS